MKTKAKAKMPSIININNSRFYINIVIISIFFLSSAFLNGCIQDIIGSGKNSDYNPENINGYPDTIEKKGMAEPKIIEITPKNKYYGPECKITVIFNEKMNRTSVEEKFRIYDSEDYPYHGKFIWGAISQSDAEYFDFIPLKQLPTGEYNVILLEGAKSSANITMPEKFTSSFTFKPIPAAK